METQSLTKKPRTHWMNLYPIVLFRIQIMFRTLVGFQVLTITKTSRQIIPDVEKLQLLCLDTHEIVVPFHGILDLVTVHQSSKKNRPSWRWRRISPCWNQPRGVLVGTVPTGTGDVSFLHVLFLGRLYTLPSLGLVFVEFNVSFICRSFSHLQDLAYLWNVIVYAKKCKMRIVPANLLYNVLTK